MLVVIQREGAVVMSKNVAELERCTALLVPGKEVTICHQKKEC